tara:strand:- start:656 stop:874 length:219 start_codon:yes stop_codon:yes gene_type:complete
MLDPNIPEDLYSIEKCRNIKNEIMNFGVNNKEIIKIIDMLSLELEDIELMKSIRELIFKEKVNTEEKPDILL